MRGEADAECGRGREKKAEGRDTGESTFRLSGNALAKVVIPPRDKPRPRAFFSRAPSVYNGRRDGAGSNQPLRGRPVLGIHRRPRRAHPSAITVLATRRGKGWVNRRILARLLGLATAGQRSFAFTPAVLSIEEEIVHLPCHLGSLWDRIPIFVQLQIQCRITST